MSVWTMVATELDADGETVERGAFLLDSVTMTPIALPLFADVEDAEAFLEWYGGADIRRSPWEMVVKARKDWYEARELDRCANYEADDDNPCLGRAPEGEHLCEDCEHDQEFEAGRRRA